MNPSRSLRSARAFSLLELAVVGAAVAVAITVGVAGINEMATTQKRNASLALANLALREQRALALERRTGRFVKPAPSGSGLITGTATVAGTACTEATEDPVTPTPGIVVDGELVCFTRDGESAATTPSRLQFRIPGALAPLAEVSVYKAGTLSWSGATFIQSGGIAETSFTVKSVAEDTFSASAIQ